VCRLRLVVEWLMHPGAPRHKAVWAMPSLISYVRNLQGMRLAPVLIRVIMVIRMSGGLMIKRSLMGKVLMGISEILIKGIMMEIRVLVMVMLEVIMEIIVLDVHIEIIITISLGTGIISKIQLVLMVPVLIAKHRMMLLNCNRHPICQRPPWRWCRIWLLLWSQALRATLALFLWLLRV
jgi:hypothetical protein